MYFVGLDVYRDGDLMFFSMMFYYYMVVTEF